MSSVKWDRMKWARRLLPGDPLEEIKEFVRNSWYPKPGEIPPRSKRRRIPAIEIFYQEILEKVSYLTSVPTLVRLGQRKKLGGGIEHYRTLITKVRINRAHPRINKRPITFLAAVTRSNIK